jgi:hypothetical protein
MESFLFSTTSLLYYIATMLYCYAERINALQVSGQDKIGISFGLFQQH